MRFLRQDPPRQVLQQEAALCQVICRLLVEAM